ncbi:hypothetical protein BCR42DRAFT_407774 [Absidia repens]|uniref:Galactose oxidase n=1 Tax=Absidia repens TaxID=90262 RepID=A0A1X2ISL6_9FUNG|nr:hypothetical protein BCR42DRAFT_407774 [Absidia repens]
MILLYQTIFSFLIVSLFYSAPKTYAQIICDNNGPQSYSDFNIIQIESTLYLTGGNPTDGRLWTLDLAEGLDTTQCLPWGDLQQGSDPYMYGVAFKAPGDNIIVQAGDGGSQTMGNGMEIDRNTNSWSDINSRGQAPEVRAEMTASLNATTKQAWYYGGRNTQSQQASGNYSYFNDFYFLDTATNTWNWPTVYYTGGVRPSRFGHTSSLLMGQLFILGGKTAIWNTSDLSWIVDVADFRSVLVFDTIIKASISMATINDIPQGRIRFSATNAPDGRSIVIFGGKTIEKHSFVPTNDVFILDTCALSWSTPNIQGTPPSPRAGHEAITIGNYMIIIGGITNVDNNHTLTYANDVAILDMTTWTWVKSIPPGAASAQQPINPGCRFDMRVSQDDNDDGSNSNGNGGTDNDGLPYDSTVVSNPNTNDNIPLKEGLGIGFGIFGLLLCGGLFLYIRRLRRASKTFSPRWLPTIFQRSSSTRSRPSTSSSLPSNNSDMKDCSDQKKNGVPLSVITEHPSLDN